MYKVIHFPVRNVPGNIMQVRDITFITTIFGARYGPFLLPYVYTVKKQHPNRRYVLYWDGVSKDLLAVRRMSFG